MAKVAFETHKGKAEYPWLNIPDTQFDAEGKFKTGLRVPADQCKELRDKIRQFAVDEFGKKADTAKVPYKQDPETGEIILNAKSKYQPKVYDSKGQIIVPSNLPQIWGGSVLKMGGTLHAYNSAGNMGVSMQLTKIQVIDLAERQDEGGGFAAEEGSFVASEQTNESNDNGSSKEDKPEDGFSANF